MPATLQIRPERPDQPEVVALLDALDAYLASLYAPEDNHILDVQALQAPDIRFLVARLDGRAVGTGALRCMPGEPASGGRPYGEVKRMVVDPALRGQGVGRALLAAVEDTARAEGLAETRLETGRDQRAAVRLYEAAGYTRCGPFAGYPDNGLSVFYVKDLRNGAPTR